jgi:hypothetical protein
MIGRGGTAGEGEFREGGLGRGVDVFRVQTCPDRVEGLEPVKQVGVLGGGNSTREGLVKMMVGVHQPR